ncbi:MAG: excinuclease ABC subunit UvrC [Candidatus Omnitrophica bacterium]|nr:excinuclease ABC subunit UvrC [Candidatus Omnitrophota bacterium]
MMKDLKAKIMGVPQGAGVYIMKDKKGEVIYIGKAKSLKKRLNTYLGKDLSTKTIALMSSVSDLEYRVCPNESLALLLEASLIHKYKPIYNVSLRDDKSFPLVKISNEEFPAIYITRKKEQDGGCYLGPYTNSKLLRQALKIIRRNFPYRTCRKIPNKACIYYRLNLCPACCMGKISKNDYSQIIGNISLILEGSVDTLIKKLSFVMENYSKDERFEESAKIRDQISALSAIAQSQGNLNSRDELQDLKILLRLDKIPQRIEVFDISNISGKEAVGSMVSFFLGEPDKNNYRKFKIKTVTGVNDYEMTAEVLRRRYSRLIKENSTSPDLILIDGGKGHLNTAAGELKKLGLKIVLASIARKNEHIYTQDKVIPIKLESDTPALNLIRRLRDEAHRFAMSYHRLLRRKKLIGR